MTLAERQHLFMDLLGQLLSWIYDEGYAVSGGDLHRTQAQADANAAAGVGISHSLHISKLAIDLENLHKDGVCVVDENDTAATVEAYRPLGEYWKSLHPDACWGGDWARPDAFHFSLAWQGVR